MAKILDNPHGGRRMIRLTSDDVIMVVSMLQTTFKGQPTDPATLRSLMSEQPMYLPEDVS